MYGLITLKIPLNEADGTIPEDMTEEYVANLAKQISLRGFWTVDMQGGGQYSPVKPFVSEIRTALVLRDKEFNVVVRHATGEEIKRTGANANVHDGAGAIEVNGQLVCITDEYGTAAFVDKRLSDEMQFVQPMSSGTNQTVLEALVDIASTLVPPIDP